MKTILAHNPIWELELLCFDDKHRWSLDRVGGVPLGLPIEKWPTCESCREPLTFVGQWQHEERRIDLGGPGSVLYSFLCTNEDTIMKCHMNVVEPGSESIARVIVVENAVAKPTHHPGLKHPPGVSLVVTDWVEREESAPAALVDAELFGLHQTRQDWPEMNPDCASRAATTRIGGRPIWIQDPYFQPKDDPWRYRCIAQWTPFVELPHQRVQNEPTFVGLEHERARTKATMLERIIAIGRGTAMVRTLGGLCGAVDGAFFNTTPTQGTRMSTSLDSGVLSLLADQRTGEFCLQYFGR